MHYKRGMEHKKILSLLFIGIFIAVLISFFKTMPAGKDGIVASNFGGPFTLTTHEGKQVTEKDFEGQYRLIYFGFTYCPAICPTELQRISTILNTLGPAGETIQPLFITVDPERDTIEQMQSYVGLFHPRLVGLTGTIEQIAQIKKGYKVYSQKVESAEMTDYTVDHSSFIYFMGADNSLIKLFKADDKIEDMIAQIKNSM